MEPATILFTAPMVKNDPTTYTHGWAQRAVAMAKSLGYRVVVLEKDNANYKNVSDTLVKYNPKVVVHYGHGCRTNLQGQEGCIITRNYSGSELLKMAEGSIEERMELLKILKFEKFPLGQLSCPGICNIDNDPCADKCIQNTNVGLLKDKIVFTTACFSADQLGKCAIKAGASCYIGSDELFLFPVDRMGSQNMFGELQLIGLREILSGGSVADAEAVMSEEEDKLIREYKPIKYMSLSLLWNKVHRKVLGNKNATIYSNPFFGVPIIPWI